MGGKPATAAVRSSRDGEGGSHDGGCLTVFANGMDFVEEVDEPLADALPGQIMKKNGRPWEL